MSNELTLAAAMVYADSEGSNVPLSAGNILASVATKKFMYHKQSIGTSAEAIQLGEVTSPGWAILINRDTTNYIELKVSSSGAIFAKLLAGEFCLLRLGSGAQVPYAIANTAACQMEFLIAMT